MDGRLNDAPDNAPHAQHRVRIQGLKGTVHRRTLNLATPVSPTRRTDRRKYPAHTCRRPIRAAYSCWRPLHLQVSADNALACGATEVHRAGSN